MSAPANVRDPFGPSFLEPSPQSYGATEIMVSVQPAVRSLSTVRLPAALGLAAGLSLLGAVKFQTTWTVRAVDPPSQSSSPSPASSDLLEKLRSLPHGWDSYDAEPPSERALEAAQQVLSLAEQHGLRPTHIGASVEGGICISFEDSNRYGDVECFNDGSMVAAKMSRGDAGEPDVWDVEPTLEGIRDALGAIRGFVIGTEG